MQCKSSCVYSFLATEHSHTMNKFQPNTIIFDKVIIFERPYLITWMVSRVVIEHPGIDEIS